MTYARPRHAPDATETREGNETASSAVCSRALLVFTPDGARIVGYDDESMSGLILGGIKGLPKPARRGTCPGGLHSWIHPTASTICPCPSSLSPATLRNFHPAEKWGFAHRSAFTAASQLSHVNVFDLTSNYMLVSPTQSRFPRRNGGGQKGAWREKPVRSGGVLLRKRQLPLPVRLSMHIRTVETEAMY